MKPSLLATFRCARAFWLSPLLSVLVLAGCARQSDRTQAELSVTATAGEAPQPAPAEPPPTTVIADPPQVRVGANAGQPGAAVPRVNVSSEGRSVKVTGPKGQGTVDVQGEPGQGSVRITPTGTVVKGPDGETVVLPAAPR